MLLPMGSTFSSEALPPKSFTVFQSGTSSSGPSDWVHDPVEGTFHFQVTTIFELTFTKDNNIGCKIIWGWKAKSNKEFKWKLLRVGVKKLSVGSYKKFLALSWMLEIDSRRY